MSDTTPGVDLVALVKECRMGLSVLLSKDDMDYDPSAQARELIGRVDRIVDELVPALCVECGTPVIHGECPKCPEPRNWSTDRRSTTMTKSKTMMEAAAGEGCLGRSQADEPVFVICARDPQGGHVVRLWAKGAIDHRVDPDKIADALRIASSMDEWHEQQENLKTGRDMKAAQDANR